MEAMWWRVTLLVQCLLLADFTHPALSAPTAWEMSRRQIMIYASVLPTPKVFRENPGKDG